MENNLADELLQSILSPPAPQPPPQLQQQPSVDPSRKDSVQSQQNIQEDAERLQQRKRQDAKSIFVENVDYKTTREELQIIFEDCGQISRITIVKDPFTKQPKGCAYLSFENEADVETALLLTGTRLRGRVIKVQRKRTNIMGMNKKAQGARNIQFLNEMMIKMTSQNYRGKPRGRGR